MRRAGGNNKAHHQKRSRQDAGGVQGKDGYCYGGRKGRRRQPRRRIHRGHMAAELVRYLCWATTTQDSPCEPTPTPPGRSRTRPHKQWAALWRRSCKQKRLKNTGEKAKASSPVLFKSFRAFPRVGHGVGQVVAPHFDPRLKVHFYSKKAPKTEVSDAFWSCWADSNRRPHPYQRRMTKISKNYSY